MDNPPRGIALLIAATMMFSLSDVMGKYLARTVPVIEFTTIRYVIFVLFALALSGVSPAGWTARLRVRRPLLQIGRGLGLIGSAILFLLGVRTLPLAEATAINFASPLLVILLSASVLGETVGWRRWLATAVGLAGVLVVARPGGAAFQPAALFVVGAAMCWAMAQVLTRKLSGTDRPGPTLLWAALAGLAVLLALLPFVAAPLAWWQLGMAVAIGVVASLGQWLMLLAFGRAAASVLAPFGYLQLIWAAALGWLVFGALPDRFTVLGAAIIIGSGLYILHRERVRRREMVKAGGPPGVGAPASLAAGSDAATTTPPVADTARTG